MATLGGVITLERTDEALTPYGGLAAWSAFLKHLGTIDWLAECCPAERTSPSAAPVREILHSFVLTGLMEGRRFTHGGWVRDDLGGAAVLGLAETTLCLEGWRQTRRIVLVRTLKPANAGLQEEFWNTPEDEVCVSVTNLSADEASAEQVVRLYRKRADAENVFDEVKNQWGCRGFCRQRGVVTERAARLVWLTYNLWTLFVRWMGLEPGQHTEAVRSQRQFLVLAAQMSWSRQQRTWKLAVGKQWWQQLKGCYERLCLWLKATAPQLETQRQFLRLLAFETPVDPGEWFAQTVLCPSG